MTWCLTLCLALTTSTTTLGISEAQQNEELTPQMPGASAISESMSSKSPLVCGPYCVWEGKGGSDESLVDPQDLIRAIENSASWIRAVLREEHVPDELEQHIVGVVNNIEGYDVTRVAFDTDGFQVLVTQDSKRIVVVVRPECTGASRTPDPAVYMEKTLELLFNHAAGIKFLSQIKEAPFGVTMTRDENLYDENGVALSRKERERISDLAQPQASDEYHRLKRIHEEHLQEIDPSLPKQSIGGSINYWWGLLYAATDGHLVIFSAPKSNGGPLVVADCKDWFRKDKLARPAPRNPRKRYRPGSLAPPKDAPSDGVADD